MSGTIVISIKFFDRIEKSFECRQFCLCSDRSWTIFLYYLQGKEQGYKKTDFTCKIYLILDILTIPFVKIHEI